MATILSTRGNVDVCTHHTDGQKMINWNLIFTLFVLDKAPTTLHTSFVAKHFFWCNTIQSSYYNVEVTRGHRSTHILQQCFHQYVGIDPRCRFISVLERRPLRENFPWGALEALLGLSRRVTRRAFITDFHGSVKSCRGVINHSAMKQLRRA